ncbi:hypothetical protein [Micromonospora sp. DT227]|uniref:hypothetical protein n=1 Tax=Micromonospora sp. DT227 TaxID=3393433 RepID=UPI003CFB1BDE
MTVRVEFDKTSYSPIEPIKFQVVIEGEPTMVTKTVTVNGTVTLPGATTQDVSGITTVVDKTVYGPFTADGYDVVQDPADPSRYTATPVAR